MDLLGAVFGSFDRDGDGKISPSELALCAANAGVELSLEDAETLLESVADAGDGGGTGLLDLEGFARLVEAAEARDEEERDRDLRVAFEMYESEGEGCITARSLSRMLSRLGSSRDIEECRSMICCFDLDGDGVLSFEEFRIMMMV